MGYRSDVVLVLTKKGVEELKKALVQPGLEPETKKEVESLLANPNTHLNDPESGSELWYWADLKWYMGYPDVDFIESFTASGVDEDEYRFIRIGEDYDDLEESGYYFDDPFDLCLTRRIDFASA